MRGAQAVIFDSETEHSCSGNFGTIERLVREAFASDALQVRTIRSLPESTRGEPDVVVFHVPRQRPIGEVLRPLRSVWRSVAVLGAMCTGSWGLPELVGALRDGLDDFLCCPFSSSEFAARLHRLLPEQRAPRSERAAVLGGAPLDSLVGESKVFLAAVARVLRIASSGATVLLGGETGVGKGQFARAIHYSGVRKNGPFVPVNCGALHEQLFENELFGHARGAYTDASSSEKGLLAEAEGGTVFLDEVDTLAPSSQAKLLHFLQDREYRPLGTSKILTADVRVVAASNAVLRELVAARQFRQDLFHRLNVLCLDLPPLRERVTDIPLLARHFLSRYAAQAGSGEFHLTRAALRKMLSYSWPGNVRELEGLLHRAAVFSSSPVIDADDIELPGCEAPPIERCSLQGAKDEAMAAYLRQLLVQHDGNVSHAAHAAGSDRRTFQRLLRKYGIAREAFHNPR